MSEICIRLAQLSDRDQLVRLREALWPKSRADELARELTLILEGKAPVTMPLIILVAEADDRVLAGFLELDLRSHADGCNPSRPVGYIEGWYVAENHRHRGIGRKLLAVAEDWARSQGCVEMASDTWLTMKCRNACTRRWGTRWWTAVCITVRRCDMHPEAKHSQELTLPGPFIART